MTSDKKFENETDAQGKGTPEAQPGSEAPKTDQAGGTVEQETSRPAVSEDVAQLKSEVADLKDRLLRAHAEMDNVRKRLEREKAEQAKFAITKFARDIVAVGDNVQRAIDAVPPRMVEQDTTLKSFFEGVTMIERELLSVLSRHGITRLDPKGEPFNPHHHQAVVEVPSEDVPAGSVTQVFQSGYMIEERVLRPAMVAVSKGGAKPAPPTEAADASAAGSGTGEASTESAAASTSEAGHESGQPGKRDGEAGGTAT